MNTVSIIIHPNGCTVGLPEEAARALLSCIRHGLEGACEDGGLVKGHQPVLLLEALADVMGAALDPTAPAPAIRFTPSETPLISRLRGSMAPRG